MNMLSHPLVRYVKSTSEAHAANADHWCCTLNTIDTGLLPETERLLIHRLRETRVDLARVSKQLEVAISELARIQQLARVCSPEVLLEQLQDVLDDAEFRERFMATVVNPESESHAT